MIKIITSTSLSARIWLLTSVVFAVALMFYSIVFQNGNSALLFLLIGFLCSLLGSFPALIAFFIAFPILKKANIKWQSKFGWFMLLVLCIDVCYSAVPSILGLNFFDRYGEYKTNFLEILLLYSSILFTCTVVAVLCSLQHIAFYLSDGKANTSSYSTILQQLFYNTQNIKTPIMDYETMPPTQPQHVVTSNANKILIKGLITGALILLMLVPTLFINNLINEREARQKEVVKEVSSKWASAQTLSAPFITVPYSETFTNSDGKIVQSKTQLIVLTDRLLVNGKVMPEERPRSIYKVLLYRTTVNFEGSFKPTWPADINTANIDFANAKLCFSLSDFKGKIGRAHV